MKTFSKISGFLTAMLVSVGVFASSAQANHSWNGYHWARNANPFTLQLGDSVSSTWDSYLGTTASDWSVSSVLDVTIVRGSAKGSCKPTDGRVEVCNKAYGKNGWLGIASIWVNGSHITKGAVKMNDTYFNMNSYNTPAWRNLVMCQEVGHTLGLDHQDENFDNPNLGTCMDYTNDPSTNQHPNQHDYDQLENSYSHLDSFTTIVSKVSGIVASAAHFPTIETSDRSEWGTATRTSHDGHSSLYERNLSNGEKVFTFVIWAF